MVQSILPFALIVVFGAVAIWLRKLAPRVSGFIALVLGATFIVFMFNDPDPRGRSGDALSRCSASESRCSGSAYPAGTGTPFGFCDANSAPR